MVAIRFCRSSLACALGTALLPLGASALTPINGADLSPDISLILDGSIFNDEDVLDTTLVAESGRWRGTARRSTPPGRPSM